MAYKFLNTTTYSKPLQMQEELINQIMNQQQGQQPMYDFNDLEEIANDQDLIEIMEQQEYEDQQESQQITEPGEDVEDNQIMDSTNQLILSMLLDDGNMTGVGTVHSKMPIPNSDDIRRRDRKPRIWFPDEQEEQQYGGYGKKPKYQTGGSTRYDLNKGPQEVRKALKRFTEISDLMHGDANEAVKYIDEINQIENVFDKYNVPKRTKGNSTIRDFEDYFTRERRQATPANPDPIYTNNPNDPRLRNYNDSMLLYKSFKGNVNRLKNSTQQEWWDYVGTFQGTDIDRQTTAAFDRLGQPKPIKKLEVPMVGLAQEYAMPKQKVIYQPVQDRNIPATEVEGIDMTQIGAINPSGRFTDVSQKPTKYLITYRDESSPSKQNTTYFKNKKEWQDFLDSGAYSPISTSQTEDSATAAGYVNRQYGGTLYANTGIEQHIGLNNPIYNTAILPLSGTNTIRGLDNYQPVVVTDGRKYKILNGPEDTAKFRGKVYEQRLN